MVPICAVNCRLKNLVPQDSMLVRVRGITPVLRDSYDKALAVDLGPEQQDHCWHVCPVAEAVFSAALHMPGTLVLDA